MASSYLPNFFKAYLAIALNAGGGEGTIYLDRITTLTGETIETADINTLGRGVITINPDGDGNTSYPESVSFTGVSGTTLVGAVRGLDKASNSIGDYMRYHPVGTPVIISIGTHEIADIIAYINSQVIGSRKVVVAAIAGETIAAAGTGVYFNAASGQWFKWTATDTTKSESVLLGITQGSGATLGLIGGGGVLLFGLDSNQAGLTVGAVQYVGDTSGAVSATTGTLNVPIGNAKSATELYFSPYIGVVRTTNVQTLQNKTFQTSAFEVTINTQTSSYTLVLTDKSKMVQMNSASANNLTVPLNSSVAYAIGTKIAIRQLGVGQTTIVATGGVTLQSPGGALKIVNQYDIIVLIKVATDTWGVEGNLQV